MRIISGKYKGKILKEIKIEGTRPTMDRVKESMFAMIQNKIPGSTCLDLFCGSGSLGIEALSNCASVCYFVDKNKKITDLLKTNTKDIDGCIILNKDYKDALKNFNQGFDIIFLDPPYDMFLINDCLNKIKEYNLLKSGGIIVCEYTKEKLNDIYPIYKERKYGDKYIKIYINEEK